MYSPTSPFFLLFSEHQHCNKVATNSNSENVRSKMLTSLRGSVGAGTKVDESSIARVWADGFHHLTARSRLARVLKLMNRLFLLIFHIFSGRGKPRITETGDNESADSGVRLYRVSQEECARLRESVPYVKLYRYNPKHLYPKLNGYGDNGQRSLKL